MKIPTPLLASLLAISLSLPLTLSAPLPTPQSGCQVSSINGVTTQSGECGGNQQASASSSGPGGSSSGGNPAAAVGLPDLGNLGESIGEDISSSGGSSGGAGAGDGAGGLGGLDLSGAFEGIKKKVGTLKGANFGDVGSSV